MGEVPSQPNQSTFGPIEFSEKPLGAKVAIVAIVAKVFSRQFCNFLSIKTADINRLMEYSKHPFAYHQKIGAIPDENSNFLWFNNIFQLASGIFQNLNFATFTQKREANR